MAKESPFSRKELEEYQAKLLEQLQLLKQNLTNLEDTVMRRSRADSAGDLTNIPTHIADISNDVIYHDITLGLMRNETQVMKDIEDALQRIEDRTYGICENCCKPIAKKRLDYVPYTRLCITCKSEEEKRQKKNMMW